MARKRKHPELELGPIITKAIVDYLGTPTLNRMTSEQRASLIDTGTRVAREVGLILEKNNTNQAGLLAYTGVMTLRRPPRKYGFGPTSPACTWRDWPAMPPGSCLGGFRSEPWSSAWVCGHSSTAAAPKRPRPSSRDREPHRSPGRRPRRARTAWRWQLGTSKDTFSSGDRTAASRGRWPTL